VPSCQHLRILTALYTLPLSLFIPDAGWRGSLEPERLPVIPAALSSPGNQHLTPARAGGFCFNRGGSGHRPDRVVLGTRPTGSGHKTFLSGD